MKITPDVVRCEFIGTQAKIHRSSHPESMGISGRVVDETRNTFSILQKTKCKIVTKQSNIFRFMFPDHTVVEIDGKMLVGRPEDRLKKSIRRLW
jgi:ribonuclease P protein subunit POP4